MAGGGLLLVMVVVYGMAAAAAAAAALSGGSGFQGVLSLERVFPVGERVELDVVRARDRARHARMLQRVSAGVVDFPVGGTADPFVSGLYYTKVRLGSPPQEFSVQIDTGSDVLWVTCSSCSNCPQSSGLGIPLNFFNAATSSTVSHISCSDDTCASIFKASSAECSTEGSRCGYTFQYGDGSATAGFYVSDILYFDTVLGNSFIANSSAPIVFGCSTSLSGDLTESVRALDGILGLGQRGLSVISQLSSRGITPKVFSHCLKGEGSGGGILVLGEILDPRIVYTPLVPSQLHYSLYLESISVNGQILPIDKSVLRTSEDQGTIVDSGTTLVYLVEGAYDPFVAAITAVVSPVARPIISKGYQCYIVPESMTELFPEIAFNFAGGASMILRPVDYLVKMGFMEGATMWCMGLLKDNDQGLTILGDLVLKDKIVVYDLSRKRIGWADYDCLSTVNVSMTSGKDEYVNAGQLSVSGSSPSTELFKIMHKNYNALLLHILVLIWLLFL